MALSPLWLLMTYLAEELPWFHLESPFQWWWNWSSCVELPVKEGVEVLAQDSNWRGHGQLLGADSFYLGFGFYSFLLKLKKTIERKSLLFFPFFLIMDGTPPKSQSPNYVRKFQHNVGLVLLNRAMRLWKNENIDFLRQRQGGLSLGFLQKWYQHNQI